MATQSWIIGTSLSTWWNLTKKNFWKRLWLFALSMVPILIILWIVFLAVWDELWVFTWMWNNPYWALLIQQFLISNALFLWVVYLLAILAQYYFQAAYYNFAAKNIAWISDIKSAFPRVWTFWKLFWTYIVIGVIAAILSAILWYVLWSASLEVANAVLMILAIVLWLWTKFIPVSIFNKDLWAWKTLKDSFGVVYGNFFVVLGLTIVEILIIMLWFLALWVWIFFALPLVFIADTKAYQLLTGISTSDFTSTKMTVEQAEKIIAE